MRTHTRKNEKKKSSEKKLFSIHYILIPLYFVICVSSRLQLLYRTFFVIIKYMLYCPQVMRMSCIVLKGIAIVSFRMIMVALWVQLAAFMNASIQKRVMLWMKYGLDYHQPWLHLKVGSKIHRPVSLNRDSLHVRTIQNSRLEDVHVHQF